MKKYAFINRYDKNIGDSDLSFYAMQMYVYMVHMLANGMKNVCNEFDMVLSISCSPDELADESLVNATILELINEKWIVEVKN